MSGCEELDNIVGKLVCVSDGFHTNVPIDSSFLSAGEHHSMTRNEHVLGDKMATFTEHTIQNRTNEQLIH